MEEIKIFLNEHYIYPDEINGLLEQKESSRIEQKTRMAYLLLRPQLSLDDMIGSLPSLAHYNSQDHFLKECLEEAEILIKYDSYIQKEIGRAHV